MNKLQRITHRSEEMAEEGRNGKSVESPVRVAVWYDYI